LKGRTSQSARANHQYLCVAQFLLRSITKIFQDYLAVISLVWNLCIHLSSGKWRHDRHGIINIQRGISIDHFFVNGNHIFGMLQVGETSVQLTNERIGIRNILQLQAFSHNIT
jgi:hypothetical protein